MSEELEGAELKCLPVLPLRDIVIFPHMVVSLFVGRKRSIEALNMAVGNEGEIVLVAQRDGAEENPGIADLYSVGASGTIVQKLKLPDGSIKVLVEGHRRVRIQRYEDTPTMLMGEFAPLAEVLPGAEEDTEIEGLARTLVSQFDRYVRSSQRVNQEVLSALEDESDYSRLGDVVAAHLPLKLAERQKVLEQVLVRDRLEFLLEKVQGELDLLKVEKRIRSRVRTQVERTQREYYLNEQLKAIQKELGDGEDSREEMQELEEKLKKTKFSKEARTKATAEMRKLKNMNSVSAEATVVRNYLDWLISVPWKKNRRVKGDLREAQKTLEEGHYGLEKVKDRILEYLAVQARTGSVRGQILCLVGPPGVGKSSLGRSIAEATGRSFVRVSLGGVRDEAEIRGHRRTYIGSMPGRILQGMKKAGSSNPLFLLDEVDKLGSDWRGDPASALLEVLDPEQNEAFNDHYLEVDYDLSKVMFITTANTLNISRPLLDRMEVIRIAGYTEDEKLEIARRHLLPRQYKEHGLKKGEWQINDAALQRLIREYTRESGVRNLEREIAKLMRKAVTRVALKQVDTVKVTVRNLESYSGVPKYRDVRDEESDLVGVSTGLAWTEVGGELLLVEAVTLGGKGRATATGTLG
ncbi:MAG: endopeptidase La, partial [Alphaproteobacteria bacterium]